MSVPNEYYDLLHAYALGCLNKSDLEKLQDYLKTSNDFPWEELGEYQNLIALLPSILSIEAPNPQLKDKVARRLYRVKEERVAKGISPSKNIQHAPVPKGKSITNDKNAKPFTQPEKKEETLTQESLSPKEMQIIEKDSKPGNHIPDTNEFQAVISKKKILETIRPSYNTQIRLRVTDEKKQEKQNEPAQNDEIIVNNTFEFPDNKDDDKFYKIPTKEPPKIEKKSYPSFERNEKQPKIKKNTVLIITSAVFLIVLAGIIILYYNISSDVSNYKVGVEKLNRQINDLSTQVNTNQDLQKLLVTKDVKIVNLNGTKLAQEGYGKLIISFEEDKGYLQLFDMPPLAEGKSYELWINISGKLLALGVFKTHNIIEYFPFSVPEMPENTSADFYLTETPSGDSQKPFGNIYLTGTIK